MNKIYTITLIIVFSVLRYTYAQNISINTSGSAPHSSAILDISSNEKGILIPRLTSAQRQALKDPATGLILYNTTGNQLNYYDGSGWYSILNTNVSSSSGSGTASGGNTAINSSGNDADPSAILDISSVDKGLLIPRTTRGVVSPTTGLIIYNSSTNKIDYYNGSSWNTLCSSFMDNVIGLGATAHGVAINSSGSSSDASAILDVSSANKGILIPRMTSVQRNAIKSPATGLMIYNTSTSRIESWDGANWYELQNDSDTPLAPTASAATNITDSSFDANWTASSGATSYFIDVDDNSDFSSPVAGYNNLSIGNVTTYNISGLTCGTTYYYRVRASSDCGISSNSSAITVGTSFCVVYCSGGPTAVVDVTNPATGKIWMDRNLGATRVALSSNDALAYGDLYQWGRLSDGHQCRTSATTTALSSTDVPGHEDFIVSLNWRNPINYNLWQGVSGINNPCPSGYRIPTTAELDGERLSWVSNDATGAFNSPLRLSVGGQRVGTSGTLFNVGSRGHYWGAGIPGTQPVLGFFISAGISGTNTSNGMSVRCIKN